MNHASALLGTTAGTSASGADALSSFPFTLLLVIAAILFLFFTAHRQTMALVERPSAVNAFIVFALFIGVLVVFLIGGSGGLT